MNTTSHTHETRARVRHLRSLIERSVGDSLKNGGKPRDCATRFIDAHWEQLDAADRSEIILCGVLTLMDQERAHRRRQPIQPSPKQPEQRWDVGYARKKNRKDIEDIHMCHCPLVSAAKEEDPRTPTWERRRQDHHSSFDEVVACLREWKVGFESELGQRSSDALNGVFETMADVANEARREGALMVLESINYVGVDGTTKSLASFSTEDLAAWQLTSRSRASAWSQREIWFSAALRLITDTHVSQVSQLPLADLIELSSSAESIWKTHP